MTQDARFRDIEPMSYLRWAKSVPLDLRYNFCSSGIRPVQPREFGINWPENGLTGLNADGMPLLRKRIAGMYGVDEQRVLLSLGATMANYLLFSTLVRPGDRVAVETPVYEPLWRVPQHLGAEISFFERRFDDEFRLPMEQLRALRDDGVRVIVLSHPHNPSAATLSAEQLFELADLVDGWDGYLVSDEVYLHLVATEESSACRFHERIISTNSLTKALGFPGIRCGWAIAPPEVVKRAQLLNDYVIGANPWVTESLARQVLLARETYLLRARRIANQARPLVDSFVERCPAVSWVAPKGGIIGWLKLQGIDSEKFARYLRSNEWIGVVPGEFFRAPGFLRIGFGLPPADLERGLEIVLETFRAYQEDPFAQM